MVRAMLGALFALAGCIHDKLVPCANGQACPIGLVCDVAHGGCTTPEQIAACDGQPDLAVCEARAIGTGVCHDGVCLPAGCGNGRRDPGEACDDGNTVARDGCAADCSSNETCGNATIDVGLGESCDDGDLTSHDGCDSTCVAEVPAWSQRRYGSPPGAYAGFAYDEARRRVVAFDIDRTLEWDGRAWVERVTSLSPPNRVDPMMVYDAARAVVVLHGGLTSALMTGEPLADTWTWDGDRWTELTPSPSPPPRRSSALAYDAAHERVILFGGEGDFPGGTVNDTWAWDGATWQDVTPANSPRRHLHAMAYDPIRGQLVMHGGYAGSMGPRDDTWIWDGTAWSQRMETVPDARHGHSMTFDRVLGEVILVGGQDGTTPSLATWWSWTGTTWQQRGSLTTVPTDPIVFDGNRNQSLLMQGSGTVLALEPTLLAWSPVVPAPTPTAFFTIGYFDRVTGRHVYFAGQPAPEVWERGGASWSRHTPAVNPPAIGNAGAFDWDRGRAVVFGDTGDTSTWEWDGSSWTQFPNTNPDDRAGVALAYDAARGRVVRFGGTDGVGMHDDTWTWDGAAWTPHQVSDRPPARSGAKMVFDEHRQRVVMFGGSAADTRTWEWDGSTWQAIVTTPAPARRVGHAMVYDPRRREVVLHGGLNVQSGTVVNDTWTYDGVRWRRLNPGSAPPAQFFRLATYDPVDGEVVVPERDSESWHLRWSAGRSDVCATAADLDGDGRSGCADPDCHAVCDPLCPVETSCMTTRPHCGDATCGPIESCGVCPEDCGPCPTTCGDHRCDVGEVCVGDCS